MDRSKIISVLTSRTVQQRQEIARAYKAAYGKDLQGKLRRQLSGDIRLAVLYSFYDKAHVNAKACYKAIRGAGTDEQVLIDVICTSDNAEIHSLKRAYHDILLEEGQNDRLQKHVFQHLAVKRNLETDVKADVRGDLEFVLVALLQGKRETSFNQAQVNEDTEALYSGGEKKVGTDESLFTRILVTRSFKSLRAINEAYKKLAGHDLLKAIEKETSGDYMRALITIVKTAINKNECIADILYNSMAGAGTHDDNLIRVIMAYSEASLQFYAQGLEVAHREKNAAASATSRQQTCVRVRARVMATVHPAANFNAHADAETLYNAMKGLGTDEDVIIEVLSHRSLEQRQAIETTFKSIYGMDLKETLHKELSGYFRLAVHYSFYDMAHVNALALYRAMKGLGTDETVLIDVICSCTNKEIHELREAYNDSKLCDVIRFASKKLFFPRNQANFMHFFCPSASRFSHCLTATIRHFQFSKKNAKIFGITRFDKKPSSAVSFPPVARRSLEQDVIHDASGDFERVLVAMLQGKRREKFDKDDVVKDCESLYQAGEAKFGTDEATFTKVFVNCPWEEIVGIAAFYLEAVGNDLFTTIEKETSGDYREALLALLKTALNRKRFYAEVLYQSMKGIGTHDENLVRMIMAHCNTDLADIKQEFFEMYDISLEDMVRGDTSGDQRKFLLAIFDMRHNHPVTSESAQLYPRNRRLDKHEQEAVDELLRLPYDSSIVLDIIKKQFGKVCTKTDLKNMRSRLKKTSNTNQVPFIGEEKHRINREEQLNPIFREIRDIADVCNDELFTQNMSALKCVIAAWRQGKVAIISEAGDGPGPNSSYQNVFPDDANEILIEYNSPSPYLMSNDAQ
ncbi:unnamed protein product [Hydatigera taeniaeformis]|uniref:Annexin n=1 Tax=Hydatigena taeniaeformis TaxID=6205 RepID=A0A158REE5_HYDTA|nr:unnamed protein product [Hydatigera taeniaeformis]